MKSRKAFSGYLNSHGPPWFFPPDTGPQPCERFLTVWIMLYRQNAGHDARNWTESVINSNKSIA
jgi:hypothetical protein